MELSLGQAVRKRRGEIGLTQEQLADRMAELGDETIRQSDISRIENAQVQMPRLTRIEILARALDLDLGVLLVSAGWLNSSMLVETETAGEGDPEPEDADPAAEAVIPEEEEADPAPEPTNDRRGTPTSMPSTQVREARERAIRNAYHHLADALGDSEARGQDFERRKAEFQKLVEQFERIRADFEQER